MKKIFAIAALAALCTVAYAASPSDSFEVNYPTYVLSDDSAAKPQPFEVNYPVRITPLRVTPASFAYKVVYPGFTLHCSGLVPMPVEDCWPTFTPAD